MDFGFGIPTRGVLATQQAVLALAQRGEQLGFGHLALPDHIIIPRSIASPYPYNAAGKMIGAADGDCFEQLAVLAYLAAATKKIRLLTSVMVVPHRSPVFTAKALATIDVLSNGRVDVGIGAGWMEEEFQAIGAPPFTERGKVTDEYLRIFKELWTQDAPRFDGQYANFDNVTFLPKPLQKPHPPIWVGGESPAALRRTIALGNAWYPIGSNPQFLLNTIERFSAGVERLRADAAHANRDPQSIAITYWAPWYKETQAPIMDEGKRQLFTGSDADVAGDISAFREIGVSSLLFNFARANLAESLAAMERFVAEVLPRTAAIS
ncbi:MAG: TIGR03619 family F420-dependent LLM class oxidoreductase [Burkholderiales bacterium]